MVTQRLLAKNIKRHSRAFIPLNTLLVSIGRQMVIGGSITVALGIIDTCVSVFPLMNSMKMVAQLLIVKKPNATIMFTHTNVTHLIAIIFASSDRVRTARILDRFIVEFFSSDERTRIGLSIVKGLAAPTEKSVYKHNIDGSYASYFVIWYTL